MKKYKKGDEVSYTLGVFPTIELLKTRPEIVKRVIVHDSIEQNRGYEPIVTLCEQHHIEIEVHNQTINKLSPKGNCFAIAVFDIYEAPVSSLQHVVLVNPMDMGNMGTIMRTMLGFGYKDLVVIRPAVDIYDPKVVRASMGAIFKLNVQYYDSYEDYALEYPQLVKYPFMLDGAKKIQDIECVDDYALIFGNESSGLDSTFSKVGQSVFIPHSQEIDSLNLSMAIGIGLFHFSSGKF